MGIDDMVAKQVKRADRRKEKNIKNREKNNTKKFIKVVGKRADELRKEGFMDEVDKEIEACGDIDAYIQEQVNALG